MYISAHTPDGYPYRCAICGYDSHIAKSLTANDSVCPSCGSHAWIEEETVEFNAADRTNKPIRTWVNELARACREKTDAQELSDVLVLTLNACLASHGASLWLPNRQWSGWPHKVKLDQYSTIGQSSPPAFAAEIFAKEEPALRAARWQDTDVLLIGVPVRRGAEVIGVVCIVQRPGDNPVAHRGYLRFTVQMTEMFATSRAIEFATS